MAERFKDARMTQSTPASSIDSHTQDLEDAIVAFIGVPVNEDLTGPLFDTDVDGNIIDFFRSAAAANAAGNSGPGWRIRDTTSDTEFLIMAGDEKLKFYENTGSQSSPTWEYRNEMDAATGQWAVGGDYSGAVGAKGIYGTTDFRTPAMVAWDALDWMVGGVDLGLEWTTANRSRFICKDPGDYILSFNAWYYYAGVGAAYDTIISASFHLNGSGSRLSDMIFGSDLRGTQNDDGTPGIAMAGSVGVNLDLNDYVELKCQSAGTGDYDGSLSGGGMFGHMVGRT